MRHTPGPWIVDEDGASIYAKDTHNPDTGDWLICEIEAGCNNSGLGNGEEDEANAHLVAAAPDLLEACKQALELLTGTGQDGTLGHHPDNPVPALLRAAIQKATSTTGE
jgi:hypothetical protein